MLTRSSKYRNMLKGKTAIVTGATEGMGFQAALRLAARNCRVIMACKRDATKQKNYIERITANNNVLVKYLNLKSLTSVRHFAKDITDKEGKLDLLINNAGIYAAPNRKTEDGLHPVMQVNHFGPFLLTYLLSGLLKKSAPSRIVFVASSVAFYNNLTPQNLNESASRFFDMLTYGNSKLCSIITAKMFAEKLKTSNVICNSVHPGLIQTRFLLKYDGEDHPIIHSVEPLFQKFIRLGTEDVDYGTKNILHAAIDDSVKNVTGQYFANSRIHQPPIKAQDDALCKTLWDKSEEYVKLTTEEKSMLLPR